jgi:hypothetical protein
MQSPVLEQILALGDRLAVALEAGDVDTAAALAEERADWVRRLEGLEPPSPEAVAAIAARARHQAERVRMASAQCDAALVQQLGGLGKQKQAKRGYATAGYGAAPRRTVLRRLHG